MRKGIYADHRNHIGTVGGIKFYEHPHHGDEAPLMAVLEDGTFIERSDFWELPVIDEVIELA